MFAFLIKTKKIMGWFDVKGTETEANKAVFVFAKKIIAADKGVNCNVEGSYITGYYRGKGENSYKYCYTSKEFIYCNHYACKEAVEKALTN